MRCERILMDVSYARTQKGNVGITRAVRRLSQELQREGRDIPRGCIPVAFHSRGFRIAATNTANPDSGQAATVGTFAARLLRYFVSGPARLIVSRYLPRNVTAWAWRRHAEWAFDSLSAAESPVRFGPGDVLVLGDQSWNYQAWMGAQKASSQGAKIVLFVHDLIPLRYPEFCNWLFTRAFESWLLKMVGIVDAIVCNSRSTQHDLLEYLRERQMVAPPSGYFRLGSDLDGGTSVGEIRATLRSFAAGPVACFMTLGTIEPRKNHGVVLDAFDTLWGAGQDVHLVICGASNPESAGLVQRIVQHPERGRRLLWLTDATDAEVAWMLQTFRALIFPSLAEGFGLPLVEARVHGCPVIASDLEVFIETADAGVWSFPRDSCAALASLIAHHAAADRRAEAGRQDAFSWSQSADQLMRVINGLLGPRQEETPLVVRESTCNHRKPTPNC